RVEHDRRRALGAPLLYGVREDLLGIRLNLVVDREEDRLAGPRGSDGLNVDRAAERVADDDLLAGPAAQRIVELELESRETLVVDARITEHLRRDRLLRIRAPLFAV